MDINDNQQINTFVKGMNTDVSDALIDSSQYRYAENLRLVTNTDSNSGELRLIEGCSEYDISDTIGDFTEWGDGGVIKAMTHIRDYIIIITQFDKIWVKDTKKDTVWHCIFDPIDGDKFGDYLSLVVRYETPTLVKLYIADGIHQLMAINIKDENGNTRTDVISKFSDIKSDVDVLLEVLLTKISSMSGTIPPAKVQYAYRLYSVGGASSTLSPLSNILSLYKTENEGYKPTDTATNKAVDILIPEPSNSALDHILIYRILYNQIGADPVVSLIYDGPVPGTRMYTDSGYNVEESTLADLLALIKMDFTPKIIESKNDYLFAANIHYVSPELDKTFSEEVDTVSRSSGSLESGYNRQMIESPLEYKPEYWMKPGTETPGGSGKYIDWEYTCNSFLITANNIKYRPGSAEPVKSQIASFRHGEVYRFGIVAYDNRGRRTNVKWVADIMIPETYQPILNELTIPTRTTFLGKQYFLMWQIGIKFTINQALFEEHPDIYSVEIVRMPRTTSDSMVLTQGIVSMPYRLYMKDNLDEADYYKSNYICPTGIWSTNEFYATAKLTTSQDDTRKCAVAETDNDYLMFSSPEYVYQEDDILNIISTNSNSIVIIPQYENIINTEEITESVYGNFKYIKSEDPVLDHGNYFKVMKLDENEVDKLETDDPSSWKTGDMWTWTYERDSAFVSYCNAAGISRLKELVYDNKVYHNIATYHVLGDADISNLQSVDHSQINVKSAAYPSVPDYDSLIENETVTWDTQITPIGIGTGDQYMHWSAPILRDPKGNVNAAEEMTMLDGFDYFPLESVDMISLRYNIYYPIGSTGKCIVFNTKDGGMSKKNSNKLYYPVVTIKRPTTPYGGENTLSGGSYISFGNVVYKNKENVTVTYDGDCYPGVFNYNASHAWHEPNTPCGVKQAGFYSVPLESDIDLSATYGDLMINSNSDYKFYYQDLAGLINLHFTQGGDAYLYNTAYGALPTAIQYSALNITYIDTNSYDTRVHHSELKQNGEIIDNWLNFRPANFIDVDSRFGEITNMRLFKDKMIYWQNNATGILSINERTVLNDIDTNQIVLGTGGVLQRYDYISTVHGMKPELYEAETQSDNTLYWWDGYNKEILAYSDGIQLLPLTKTKNLTNYINQHQEAYHPCLSYDIKYNEVLAKVVSQYTIVYNEQILQFSSTYTINPLFRTTINNELFLTDLVHLYKWNKQDSENVSTLFRFTNSEDDSVIYEKTKPKIEYVINKGNAYTKVFDMATFGGRFYGGNQDSGDLNPIQFIFKTPLKQQSYCNGEHLITDREYDFRLAIPRNANSEYGDRMRGKTMQCELKSSSNSTDFSLQYIITKYRMSWS